MIEIGTCVEVLNKKDPSRKYRDVVTHHINETNFLLFSSKKTTVPSYTDEQLRILIPFGYRLANRALVYISRPPELTYGETWWYDDLSRFHHSFGRLANYTGTDLILDGQQGLRHCILHRSVMIPVLWTNGALDNTLRNRCFVCDAEIVGKTFCNFCGAGRIPSKMAISFFRHKRKPHRI